MARPHALSLFELSTGARTSITTPRPELSSGGAIASGFVAPSYVTCPSSDGRFQLRLRLFVPAADSCNGAAIVGYAKAPISCSLVRCCSALADSCYPLLLAHRRPVYSNTVRNVWGRWSIFQQLLVQRGYTVVQVDLRGSTGNGRVFREEFTANVGGQDLEDLVATVSLLTPLYKASVACG